jgi:uncharacterized protein (DUF2141 family)
MPPRVLLLAAAVAASTTILGAATAPAFAATLDIGVEKVRSAKGSIRAGVFDADGKQVAFAAAPARIGDLALQVRDLAPGAYAVKLFHDENGDERLTFDAFGRPTEGVGFSNRAQANLREPSFDAMRVDVTGSTATAVMLSY